jgi:hypothetical protein
MAGKWIAGAIKHPGSFRKKAQAAGKSTAAFASEHAGDSGKLGQQARLAQTLMGMHHKPKSNAERAQSRYGKKG